MSCLSSGRTLTSSAEELLGLTSTAEPMPATSKRSYKPIADSDLARLAEIAAQDRAARFARRPRWRVYADRILSVALCQGAALHYVDAKNGVKDIDVWTFYAEHSEGTFPYRWTTWADFGESRFGRWSEDPHADALKGRRVDLIGRSLNEPPGADPVAALTRYLTEGKTESARRLAEKAVVIIDPRALRGTIVWP
jgi:hypothetical protein